MADIVMFLVQMELAISSWIRSKNEREATNVETVDRNSIRLQILASENKDNGIPRVADNAAARLQGPREGAYSMPDWPRPKARTSAIGTMLILLRARSRNFGDLPAVLRSSPGTLRRRPALPVTMGFAVRIEMKQSLTRMPHGDLRGSGDMGLDKRLKFWLYILAYCARMMLESYVRVISVCQFEYSESSSQHPEYGAQVNL
jgi:hypothetical protein